MSSSCSIQKVLAIPQGKKRLILLFYLLFQRLAEPWQWMPEEVQYKQTILDYVTVTYLDDWGIKYLDSMHANYRETIFTSKHALKALLYQWFFIFLTNILIDLTWLKRIEWSRLIKILFPNCGSVYKVYYRPILKLISLITLPLPAHFSQGQTIDR